MTADDFRDLALSMEGAIEGAHMGHPDFRANGRIFATLHSNDRFGMVRLEPDEQRTLMREHSRMFEPSAGAWGRQGCTNVRLESADTPTVRAAILLAWEHVASQPPPRAKNGVRGQGSGVRKSSRAVVKRQASGKTSRPKRRT
jgi:hypothetical protein